MIKERESIGMKVKLESDGSIRAGSHRINVSLHIRFSL